jgi:hypothetical protein
MIHRHSLTGACPVRNATAIFSWCLLNLSRSSALFLHGLLIKSLLCLQPGVSLQVFTDHIHFILQVLNILLILDVCKQIFLGPTDDCVCSFAVIFCFKIILKHPRLISSTDASDKMWLRPMGLDELFTDCDSVLLLPVSYAVWYKLCTDLYLCQILMKNLKSCCILVNCLICHQFEGHLAVSVHQFLDLCNSFWISGIQRLPTPWIVFKRPRILSQLS